MKVERYENKEKNLDLVQLTPKAVNSRRRVVPLIICTPRIASLNAFWQPNGGGGKREKKKKKKRKKLDKRSEKGKGSTVHCLIKDEA
jgi:hypothetical protein